MAASWPSAKKTFSQVVNGITKLVALLWNTNYDETEAIETYLGASGNAQTKLAALNNLMRAQFNPLPVVTWIDADTISIASCCVMMFSGSNYVIKYNASALEIKLSVDLDTGAEAASHWYDIYLVGDGASSAYTAKFVHFGNTPSGATYYKKIGSVRNDSGSNILKFWQYGHYIYWDAPVVVTTTIQSSWTDLDLSASVPPLSQMAIMGWYISKSGYDAGDLYMRPNGTAAAAWQDVGDSLQMESRYAPTSQAISGRVVLLTDSAQVIEYKSASSSISLTVEGYIIDIP